MEDDGDSENYSMSTEDSDDVEIVDAPAAFKSEVWKHFGFVVTRNEKGEKVTDKQQTVCKHCQCNVRYTSGNTSNMRSHLISRHTGKFPEYVQKGKPGQKTIREAFTTALPHNSSKAQEITRYIAEYIASDLHPFSTVDGVGFKRLVAKLEPKYKMPSRAHFSQTVFPALYSETKTEVLQSIKQSESISLTTDGWTSRATQSFITITAHIMTTEWEMKSFVVPNDWQSIL